MNVDVQSLLTSGAALTDDALERLLPAATVEPHSIHRAMRHSTFAGGKRLRPILSMEAARMIAGTLPEGAAELGAAIEMVHTYSLIHDDLPALDNDDLRRGKPTCHVAYGEAIAILAGDALQTLAFQTIANLPAPAPRIIQIMRYFSVAIGTGIGSVPDSDTLGELSPGMIGGQVMDIEAEGHKPTAELVERIHRAKTGALITASLVCGGVLGMARRDVQRTHSAEESASKHDPLHRFPEDAIPLLRSFGEKAGLAFQIVDDVLDVTQTSEQLGKTAGKDTASDKATWPAVYGVERSRKDATALVADAFAALEPFGEAAAPLKALANYLVERTH
jgi:geranylgeranyl diphosphate synthase type II